MHERGGRGRATSPDGCFEAVRQDRRHDDGEGDGATEPIAPADDDVADGHHDSRSQDYPVGAR